MGKPENDRDYKLVQQCLSGSEEAWRQFYSKYIGLVRNVARKRAPAQHTDLEDLVQAAFVSLTSALNGFEADNSLAHYVGMITERTVIDEIRKMKAAKRSADLQSVDHHDGSDDGSIMVVSQTDDQDTQFQKAETAIQLKKALQSIGERCRELITLRYYKDLSFAEMSELMKANENTLAVQTRRCLDKLRAAYGRPERKGF
jgi:RNA polymerase sigma factor (sigma-70 family)